MRLGARSRAGLPVLLAAILALSACTTIQHKSLSRPSNSALRGCTDGSAGLVRARWWPCLGDAQLSGLIEHALAALPMPALTSAQDRLTVAIARRYIALRAQQSALVLLAAREERDREMVTIARQAGAADARLADTRANQARARAAIAALDVELAVLTGAGPDRLEQMPGGPIPLPTAPLPGGDSYAAAQRAAAQAQSAALSAIAAAQTIRAHSPGTLPTRETLPADRQALDALLAEEQARAAMTDAYVVALRRDPAPR